MLVPKAPMSENVSGQVSICERICGLTIVSQVARDSDLNSIAPVGSDCGSYNVAFKKVLIACQV